MWREGPRVIAELVRMVWLYPTMQPETSGWTHLSALGTLVTVDKAHGIPLQRAQWL